MNDVTNRSQTIAPGDDYRESRGHPFINVDPDDADHLLMMIEQAHQPFRSPMVHVGDIASEWVKRWRRTQPKVERSVGEMLNPSVAGMREAYRAPGRKPARNIPEFPFEDAAAILSIRWPGIVMGEPEKAWARIPVIAELARLRLAVRQSDPNQIAEGSAKYRYCAPEILR